MSKDRATKNNNKSPMYNTNNNLQAKKGASEEQINYAEPSVEYIASIVAVYGVPATEKKPVTNPNVPPSSEKSDPLKSSELSIQGILKHKRE